MSGDPFYYTEPQPRLELMRFAQRMEEKLKKNDHKTHWRELPVEALYQLLKIELAEYEVAHQYLTVEDAQHELIDVANFCMILFDRLGMESPNAKVSSAPARPVPYSAMVNSSNDTK